ncbi:hypothetical protein SAMN06295943_0014 [Agreia sp. VKM Ac-1783]|nr:hypothetical protein SAMN06295943_0014 [Agreia sp. VKM Ac-1783]
MNAADVTTVEIIVSDDSTALGLIVRVVSTPPFSLERLRFSKVTATKSRQVLMDVVANGRCDLLSKRLNRIVPVLRVRLLDPLELSPRRKNRNDIPRTA